MKKIWVLVAAILLLCCLAGCQVDHKHRGMKPVQEEKPPILTMEQRNCDTDKITELYGYQYELPYEIDLVDSYSDGAIITCNDCTVIVHDAIVDIAPFTSWDTIISDGEEAFLDSLHSVHRVHFYNQTVTKQEKKTNPNGEELLYVEGTLDTSEGDKEFIAYYYVTESNSVQFFAGVIDNNEAELREVMQCMADHLEKVRGE